MASLGKSKEKTILFVAIGVVLVSVITISIVGVSKAKARKAAEKAAAEKAIAEQEAAERAAAAEKEAADRAAAEAEAAAKAAAENAPKWRVISSETIYVPKGKAIYHTFDIPSYSKIYVEATSPGAPVWYCLYMNKDEKGSLINPVVGSEVKSEEYEFKTDLPKGTYYLDMYYADSSASTMQTKISFRIQAWY